MKSSSKSAYPKKVPNFVLMLAALCVAFVMWYVVSVRDRLEAQVEVNIDYYGIPPNLVITDGLISKIMVRIKGSETLLRAMSRDRLTEAIDLSKIKKGVTSVPLGGDELGPRFRAFDIVDIQPPRILITADTLMERNVPLRTVVDSPLRGGALTVENVTVSPATVVLRGPEEVISNISSLPLTILLDPRAAGTTVKQNLTLETPSLVTAQPPTVRVGYTITSGRTVITRKCNIRVAGDADHNYEVSPSTITVMVEVPEALAKSSAYLNQLEVSVVPPPMDGGESRPVKPRFRLPEGMTLLNPSGEDVIVKRIGNKNVRPAGQQ